MQQDMAQDRQKEKDEDWVHFESSEPTSARPRYEIPQRAELPPVEATVQEKGKKAQETGKKALSWSGHYFQKFSNFSIFSISWDNWRYSIWDLFTHGGFLTYVHHDGAGLCTYVFIRSGCKIWGVHRPKVTEKDNTRHSIFSIMRKILRPHGWTSYMEHSDLYNVFLMPGDVL